MKATSTRTFLALVIGAVAVEETLRHLMAGTPIVATILSSGEFSWQLIVACIFVLLRLFVILILPALVVAKLAGWFWPKAK
jgi:hypothetical protein